MINLNNFLKNATFTLLFLAFSHNSFGMNVLASGSGGSCGSWDSTIKIWKPNTDGKFTCIQTIDQTSGGHTAYITSLAFNKEGLLVSGSYDKTIKIWKLNIDGEFKHIQTIDQESNGHTDWITSIAFNKDGLLVSGSSDNTIKIWKLNIDGEFKHIQTIDQDSDGHVYPPLSLAFNKDGLLASGSYDNIIKIWKPTKDWNQNNEKPFECIQTIDQKSDGHKDLVRSIAFNKDGLLAYGSYDNIIKIWKPTKDWKQNNEKPFECIQTIEQKSDGHKNAIEIIEFNTDGLLISGSYDETIKIWKPTKDWKQNNEKPFECIQTIDQKSDGHKSAVRGIASMLLGPNKFNQKLKTNYEYKDLKITTLEE